MLMGGCSKSNTAHASSTYIHQSLADVDPAAVSKEIAPDLPVGECFVNMISVDVEAYAKQHFTKSVRKSLTIPSWLNDAAIEMGLNFRRSYRKL